MMDTSDSNKTGSAQVTVRADSLRTWDFYLNGESIGRIEGRGQITAAASSLRKNVLTAKDAGGAAAPPYEFHVESGSHLEVFFDSGEFVNACRIDEAAKNAPSAVKARIWEWVYWVVLIGYCTAVFILGRDYIFAALALSFFPALVFMIKRFTTHRAMIKYLDVYHPGDLGDILRELYTSRWGPRDFLFIKDACDDPEYMELRRKHKRVLWTALLLYCTMFAAYFYFVITVTS